MKKKRNTTLLGVFIALFTFSASIKASSWLPVDGVYYYMKVGTGNTSADYSPVGYLSLEPRELERLVVAEEPDDFALWTFKTMLNEPDVFYVINKKTSDTLFFKEPANAIDVPAEINRDGSLSVWYDMFIEKDQPSILQLKSREAIYYLTCNAGGEVRLSREDTGLPKLWFTIARDKYIPDERNNYRLKVDTVGIPDVDWLGYLSADTTIADRKDSLTVDLSKDTPSRGNLSLWSFRPDTVISDTTYYQIRNKATDSLLAFDRPTDDTVACVRNAGELNLWKIPFFAGAYQNVGQFVLRDTVGHKDYYLGLRDDHVMLLTDTTNYKCMKFVIEDETPYVPDSCIVGGDSVKVHKVKYLNGPDSGKYLGVDIHGNKALLDTVYAHLPDGQFVVYKYNKYTLRSRAGSVTTGRCSVNNVFNENDSLKVVCNAISGDTIPYQYTNMTDTFEITPITYGRIDVEKLKSNLGYEYLSPDELLSSSYVFSYTSTDTLNGRVIGYDAADSLVMLLAEGDTARFVPEVSEVSGSYSVGAPAIGDIPKLERQAYRFRSTEDTTLYFSVRADSLAMDTLPYQSSFFLKEDTVPGKRYYFIEDHSLAPARKLLTDSTRHFNLARIDSTDTHLFILTRKDRYIAEEDPYRYLTELLYGRGLYELSADVAGASRFLTKNYYHYAVFGKEGESMLRAGSYAPSDFHLWVDTARGRGYNENKPSFYLIKDVDTLQSSQTSRLDVSGYFLHVMDSMSQPSHDEYTVEIGGHKYNRVNFVKAKRISANELLLDSPDPQAKDSVGFKGKNEKAINEYRFYLQVVDEDAAPNEYYVVTEQGYGGKQGIRGYLSYKYNYRDSLYVGPRIDPSEGSEGRMISLTISKANMVSNEVIPVVPAIEEVSKKRAVIGGSGQITFLNAEGERVVVYNVVGQQMADRVLTSDKETISISRGILIVKVGEKMTRKVVVR